MNYCSLVIFVLCPNLKTFDQGLQDVYIQQKIVGQKNGFNKKATIIFGEIINKSCQ